MKMHYYCTVIVTKHSTFTVMCITDLVWWLKLILPWWAKKSVQ